MKKTVTATVMINGNPYITQIECDEKEIPAKKAELIKWAEERYKDSFKIVDIKVEDIV